jgi:hypothetical protein
MVLGQLTSVILARGVDIGNTLPPCGGGGDIRYVIWGEKHKKGEEENIKE